MVGGLDNPTLYLVTIHKSRVKEYVDPLELFDKFKLVCHLQRWEYIWYSMEYHGKYCQLHSHALVCGPPNYMTIKLRDYRVWITRVEKNDVGRVYKYIKKIAYDKYIQQQLLDEYYFQHNYGFL